jgi:hypothetical protein
MTNEISEIPRTCRRVYQGTTTAKKSKSDSQGKGYPTRSPIVSTFVIPQQATRLQTVEQNCENLRAQPPAPTLQAHWAAQVSEESVAAGSTRQARIEGT